MSFLRLDSLIRASIGIGVTYTRQKIARPRNYILAVNLAAPFVVAMADLAAPPVASEYRVFDYFNPGAGGVSLDASHPLTIPIGTGQPSAPKDANTLRYFIAAPVLPGDWVLYGESGKIVPMAAKRTSGLVATPTGFSVNVAGAVGGQNEASGTVFWVVPPGDSVPVPVNCPASEASVLLCTTATLKCACN